LLDRIRTAINVLGDAYVASAVDFWTLGDDEAAGLDEDDAADDDEDWGDKKKLKKKKKNAVGWGVDAHRLLLGEAMVDDELPSPPPRRKTSSFFGRIFSHF
jgi:hypothetical protein